MRSVQLACAPGDEGREVWRGTCGVNTYVSCPRSSVRTYGQAQSLESYFVPLESYRIHRTGRSAHLLDLDLTNNSISDGIYTPGIGNLYISIIVRAAVHIMQSVFFF